MRAIEPDGWAASKNVSPGAYNISDLLRGIASAKDVLGLALQDVENCR